MKKDSFQKVLRNKMYLNMAAVVLMNRTQSKISGVNKSGSQFIARFP